MRLAMFGYCKGIPVGLVLTLKRKSQVVCSSYLKTLFNCSSRWYFKRVVALFFFRFSFVGLKLWKLWCRNTSLKICSSNFGSSGTMLLLWSLLNGSNILVLCRCLLRKWLQSILHFLTQDVQVDKLISILVYWILTGFWINVLFLFWSIDFIQKILVGWSWLQHLLIWHIYPFICFHVIFP